MHVVATAGHVDHGKSTLVRALTGMEPDRWAEERRRGMTIDLGFAWTDVPCPDGTPATVALVDVPGHQRFLGNMLAGVGPVPAAMLVVAADGGWSRQTTEHVAALDALGVRHGLLAVTRSDLADPGPATAEALDRLATTSLGRVPAVAVSGTTGEGLGELRTALGALVTRLPAPVTDGRVRLWVDRAFTVRGAGCVVTATLGEGSLAVGDELLLVPQQRRVVVRGLQSLGRTIRTAQAVARVAVNVRGVGADEVGRGDALVSLGRGTPDRGTGARDLLTATVDAVSRGGPLGDLPRTCVLHVGSAAVAVQVRPLGEDAVRLTLDRALPLRRGEPAVLRNPGQQRVAAGLTLADIDPPALHRRGAAAARASALGNGIDVVAEVRRRGAPGRELLDLLGVLDRASPVPAGLLAVDGCLVHPEDWAVWGERLRAAVTEAAAADPLSRGPSLDAAARAAPVPPGVPLAPLAAGLALEVVDGRLRPRTSAPALPPAVTAAVDGLRAHLEGRPFHAPEADEQARLGLTPAVVAAAARAGALLRIGTPPVLLLPEAEDGAVQVLAGLEQPFSASQARQALGTTRRVAIPLLEHLDARRRTRRDPSGARIVLR